jgi:Protein of unknown function (DUF2283).
VSILNSKYDSEADAVYFRLSDRPIERTEELSDICIVDVDCAGHVRGVELLSCRKLAVESLDLLVQQRWITQGESDELLDALKVAMEDRGTRE